MPSTPNIAEQPGAHGWAGLLGVLSDDELRRYGQIALDQYQRELRLWWAQAVLVALALGVVGWALRSFVLLGIGKSGVLALGLSALLGYWPYRSSKTRTLWWGHYAAVLEERHRRSLGRAEADGSGGAA